MQGAVCPAAPHIAANNWRPLLHADAAQPAQASVDDPSMPRTSALWSLAPGPDQPCLVTGSALASHGPVTSLTRFAQNADRQHGRGDGHLHPEGEVPLDARRVEEPGPAALSLPPSSSALHPPPLSRTRVPTERGEGKRAPNPPHLFPLRSLSPQTRTGRVGGTGRVRTGWGWRRSPRGSSWRSSSSPRRGSMEAAAPPPPTPGGKA
jgi:hypothetical protein